MHGGAEDKQNESTNNFIYKNEQRTALSRHSDDQNRAAKNRKQRISREDQRNSSRDEVITETVRDEERDSDLGRSQWSATAIDYLGTWGAVEWGGVE